MNVGYIGVFRAEVPLILRLWRQGKSPSEIARLVPPAGRPWLRPYQREPLSPQMVLYILRRTTGFDPASEMIPDPLASARNQAVFADFRRRYAHYEAGLARRRAAREDAFAILARWLYDVCGWLAGELEARRPRP